MLIEVPPQMAHSWHMPCILDCAGRVGWQLGERDQQVGVVGELRGVLERQARRSWPVAGHDERGDLDDLARSSGRGARLLLRSGDVVGGRGGVADTGRHDGEQGVLDGEVGHVVTLPVGADSPLTSR